MNTCIREVRVIIELIAVKVAARDFNIELTINQ